MATETSKPTVQELCEAYGKIAEEKRAWFYSQMPPAYFTENDEEIRAGHLKALIALEMTGHSQEMTLFSGDTYTFFSPVNTVGLLSRYLQRLPTDKPLREAKIYTSSDASMVIDVFTFGSPSTKQEVNSVDVQKKIASLLKTGPNLRELANLPDLASRLYDFFGRCDAAYLLSTAESTIFQHFRVLESVKDGVHVELTAGSPASGNLSPIEADQTTLLVVAKPTEFNDYLQRIVAHLTALSVDVIKAKLFRINLSGDAGDALIVTIIMRNADGSPIKPLSQLAGQIEQDVKRIAYVDDNVLSFFYKNKTWTLGECEILMCLCSLAHCLLAEAKPLVYTQTHIISFVEQHQVVAHLIVRMYIDRFNPKGHRYNDPRAFAADIESLSDKIDSLVELDDCKAFFNTMGQLLVGTDKCNYYMPDRRALALRLNVSAFDRRIFSSTNAPYGVFFVAGRQFVGFHVRFTDVARGGVRLVIPQGAEQHAVANRGLFNECYSLASAQQAKNKDIPEGGSKAVVLVNGGPTNASSAIKSFADCLLDLTVAAVKNPLVLNYHFLDEIVYLGPDENVTNHHINWISDRAIERGHPFPSTFMSSKPGAGINHKTYGVTSEGLTVYLDVALRHVGINPNKDTFTVKMTGGPDGDVAGNEIKILHREYGANCRIVAIADGFGIAKDPNGLNQEELLRLVREGSSIMKFDTSKLGPNGALISAEGEGARARNMMPFTVKSDVFIPAGGRPQTINSGNWEKFLDAKGKPVSKLIVEGANIFLSSAARKQLSDKGVVIIKDSSANKGGVVTSSYEILAGLLLTEQEFLQIKEKFVQDVLERLRGLAKLECEALLRERALNSSMTLPEISMALSSAINQASDDIHVHLLKEAVDKTGFEDHPIYGPRLVDYIPNSIRELLGPQELRVRMKRIPNTYKYCIVAKGLGSFLVYTEGIAFLKSHSNIASAAELYLSESAKVRALLAKLKSADFKGATEPQTLQQVVSILEKGGARIAMELRL